MSVDEHGSMQTSSDSGAPTEPPQRPRSSLSALGIGSTLAASVLVGLGLGHGLDRWLDTWPWWTVGGAGLFIVAGLYQVVKEAGR